MGDHLKVDTGVLDDAGHALNFVYNEFADAAKVCRPSHDAVAHGRLRSKLEDFADNWDHRREEMMKTIESLAEAAETASKTYTEIESTLVAAMEGKK